MPIPGRLSTSDLKKHNKTIDYRGEIKNLMRIIFYMMAVKKTKGILKLEN